MLYSSRHNFHLDPAPDGAAGGAANPGSPVGGDAAPAFDASQYVPKADFDRISSDYTEFRQTAEQRFQDYDSRLPKPEAKEPKADQAPRKEDYDFQKDGEFERFMDDRSKFNFKMQQKEWEAEQTKSYGEQQYRESVQKALASHSERMDAFKALNPDYDPNKQVKIGHEGVTLEILNSDFSAHIHNFLQKNPDKLKELRDLSRTNPSSAVRMVGRIEAMFENQAATAPGKKSAAAAMPTAGGFGSGKASGSKQPTKEEIFKSWNS